MLTYPNITTPHPTPIPPPPYPCPIPHHTPHRFYFILFIAPLSPFIVYCLSHTHHKLCNPILTRYSQPTNQSPQSPPHPPPLPLLVLGSIFHQLHSGPTHAEQELTATDPWAVVRGRSLVVAARGGLRWEALHTNCRMFRQFTLEVGTQVNQNSQKASI